MARSIPLQSQILCNQIENRQLAVAYAALKIFCFKHKRKQKYGPPKNVLCPQTLKPGYGPGWCASQSDGYLSLAKNYI